MRFVFNIFVSVVISVVTQLPWYLLIDSSEVRDFLLPTVALKIFFGTVIISFLLVTLQRYRDYRFFGIIYIFSAGFLYLLSYIGEIMMIYFMNSNSVKQAEIIYLLVQLFAIISPVTVILFLAAYRTNGTNPLHVLPTAVAAGMLLQAGFNGNSFNAQTISLDNTTFHFLNYDQSSAWYYIGFVGSFAYTLIYFIYSYIKLRGMTVDPLVRKQQNIFSLGIIFAVGVSPVIFILVNQLTDFRLVFTLNFSVANSFIIVAIIIALLPYIRNENPGYLQPQPMDQLMIIQKTGVLLFSYEFRSSEALDDVLFSGAVTAISSLMKEATGSASDIRTLSFEDKIMLTRFRDDLAFVLVADYSTSALTTYIDNYSSQFYMKYGEEIKQAVSRSTLLDSDGIVAFTRRSFGLPATQ